MLISILTQRCNSQRLMIAEAYQNMFGRVRSLHLDWCTFRAKTWENKVLFFFSVSQIRKISDGTVHPKQFMLPWIRERYIIKWIYVWAMLILTVTPLAFSQNSLSFKKVKVLLALLADPIRLKNSHWEYPCQALGKAQKELIMSTRSKSKLFSFYSPQVLT